MKKQHNLSRKAAENALLPVLHRKRYGVELDVTRKCVGSCILVFIVQTLMYCHSLMILDIGKHEAFTLIVRRAALVLVW
jgi:hypothetical protein